MTLYWDSEAQMAKEAEKAPVGLIFILLFFAAVFLSGAIALMLAKI